MTRYSRYNTSLFYLQRSALNVTGATDMDVYNCDMCAAGSCKLDQDLQCNIGDVGNFRWELYGRLPGTQSLRILVKPASL